MSALYIHIPFCQRKCFYCSFAVAIGQEHRTDDYVMALGKESLPYQGQKIKTVYLGGGTPSMLSEKQLRQLFAVITRRFYVSPQAEITVEANPENIDFNKARILIDLGVNRVSLGIQTFQDQQLRYLGRAHDSIRARKAFADLRQAGFRNINVDLMHAFPKQIEQELREDLTQMLALGSEHVSLYTLTVEENSRFFVQNIEQKDSHEQGDQYDLIVKTLAEAGIAQYEVSNFARPGFESRHNINYWQGGNYIGLGMSSHSHWDGRRSWNFGRLADYLKKIEANESVEEGFEVLSNDRRLTEALVFGLRMNCGVDLNGLSERFQEKFAPETIEKISQLIEQGFLARHNDLLCATNAGRRVLDEISTRLI